MASPAEQEVEAVVDFDLDRELEEALEKEATAFGIDPDLERKREMELETWQRWRENPNPEDFGYLYNSFQPVLNRTTARFKSNLPQAYMRSRVLNNFVRALTTFDPTKSQLQTWVKTNADYHLGRDIQKYTNIGRIPAERGGLIGLMINASNALEEQLGRPPSDDELSDEMKVRRELFPDIREERINLRSVGTLRQELRADRIMEGEGGATAELGPQSYMEQQAAFLRGSLNPEQQLVLEHTVPGFGKPVIADPMELSKMIPQLSPQKIRAIRMQISKKLKKYW